MDTEELITEARVNDDVVEDVTVISSDIQPRTS